MGLRQRIISEVYDEQTDKVVNREIINDKEINKPKSIEDLGYNHKAQIDMLHNIQEAFLVTQSTLITPEACVVCGGKTNKAGHTLSDFHSVYTDHKIAEDYVVILSVKKERMIRFTLFSEVTCTLI